MLLEYAVSDLDVSGSLDHARQLRNLPVMCADKTVRRLGQQSLHLTPRQEHELCPHALDTFVIPGSEAWAQVLRVAATSHAAVQSGLRLFVPDAMFMAGHLRTLCAPGTAALVQNLQPWLAFIATFYAEDLEHFAAVSCIPTRDGGILHSPQAARIYDAPVVRKKGRKKKKDRAPKEEKKKKKLNRKQW